MNAIAVFAVTAHIDYLLDEAAKRRTAPSAPSLRTRIAGAADALWGAVTAPATSRNSTTLSTHPSRG
jgi:hypothetical protein